MGWRAEQRNGKSTKVPDEGKDLWRRVVPKLVGIRLLTRENLPGFEALCSVHRTARQADEVLRIQGLVMTVGEGNYRQQRPEAVSLSRIGHCQAVCKRIRPHAGWGGAAAYRDEHGRD